MKTCYIITILNGMVENVKTFIEGRDTMTTTHIEHHFLIELARVENVGVMNSYSAEELNSYCEDGYVEYLRGTGNIQIYWG